MAVKSSNPSQSTLPSELPGNCDFFSHRLRRPEAGEIRVTDTLLFCVVLQGDGQIQYQDKTAYIHACDFLFFPKHALFTQVTSNRLLIYEISLLPYFFQTFGPEFESAAFRHFHISEKPEDPRNNEIYYPLAAFVNSWKQTGKALPLQTVPALTQLFTAVIKHFQISEPVPSLSDSYREERILQIIRYIADHYNEKITVPQISRSIGLNPQYFSSFFSRCFQRSFVDYLNQYRISRSLSQLHHPEISITQIAYDNGFQTYRSYSNAFRKLFHQSPSEYREVHLSLPDPADLSGFRFLEKYSLSSSLLSDTDPHSTFLRLDLNLAEAPVLQTDTRCRGISIGSGYQLLQENVYAQLRKAAGECSFTHVHFRDIFSDLLNVYTEPAPGQPLFTWDFTDDIIDRILTLHMHPFIELGFMPRELAATKETLGYGYHPCIGRPKSLHLWKQMIRSFLGHCLHRYGRGEMENWFFDFWDSANIRSADGYWNGTKSEFFALYQAAYQAFEEVSLEHLLGTPNFSLPGGLDWYEEFLQFCKKENLRPGYLNLHLYSCSDHLADFSGIFPQTPSNFNYLPLTDTDYITASLSTLRSLLEKYGFRDLPIIAGEWNITFYLSDLVRDTAFMATYVIHTWIRTLTLVQSLTYSCLSDISELTRPSRLSFSGSQGLISREGFTKPAYNALFLLHKMDRQILRNEYPCFITKGADAWHILLYNISDYEKDMEKHPEFLLDDYRYQVFRNTSIIHFRGDFTLPSGDYEITSYQIDREHGSVYDAWLRIGRPDPLTREAVQTLIYSSYPELHIEKLRIEESFNIDVEIKPHSVMLYEIRRTGNSSSHPPVS